MKILSLQFFLIVIIFKLFILGLRTFYVIRKFPLFFCFIVNQTNKHKRVSIGSDVQLFENVPNVEYLMKKKMYILKQ